MGIVVDHKNVNSFAVVIGESIVCDVCVCRVIGTSVYHNLRPSIDKVMLGKWNALKFMIILMRSTQSALGFIFIAHRPEPGPEVRANGRIKRFK